MRLPTEQTTGPHAQGSSLRGRMWSFLVGVLFGGPLFQLLNIDIARSDHRVRRASEAAALRQKLGGLLDESIRLGFYYSQLFQCDDQDGIAMDTRRAAVSQRLDLLVEDVAATERDLAWLEGRKRRDLDFEWVPPQPPVITGFSVGGGPIQPVPPDTSPLPPCPPEPR